MTGPPDRMLAGIGAARLGRVPLAVAMAIAGAWILAVVAQTSGSNELLHHDSLIHSDLPSWGALALFLVAWQTMIAAMMLPSSLPLLRLFAAASANQPRPQAVVWAFIGGYALVWTTFGALAFTGDFVVHQAVHDVPWLRDHPWLIAAGVLLGAGAFQFSELKDRCLEKCRHPAAFLLRHYDRGVGAGFRLGRGHGMFCLGCCWALMLVTFAAGVANLWWMAALTALMVYEKTGDGGRRSVPVTGIVLLAWGVLVALHPSWLPGALEGAL